METAAHPVEGVGHWGLAWRRLRRDRFAMVCLGIVGFYLGIAILVQIGLLASEEHLRPDVGPMYAAPDAKSLATCLGTDLQGKSVFWKMVYGARIAIFVGLVSSAIAIPLGALLGGIAGYFGGWIDEGIVWLYTTVASVPALLLILALSLLLNQYEFEIEAFRSGLVPMCLALGLTAWVSTCRIIRGEFMKHKEREYVVAARALGFGHARTMFLHILPNTFHLLIINLSLEFIYAIKSEVILSFLQVGIKGKPSWGIMIAEATRELYRGVWWQLAAATGAMFFVVLAFNILGDALRDALDPKLRQ